MFKLNKLILNCVEDKKRVLDFSKNKLTYVYALNTKGKTLMCECIDFALGSSDEINKKVGMEGVLSVETEVEADSGKIFLLRRFEDNKITHYYKKDEESTYMQINQDSYNEKITSMLLNGDNGEIKNFEDVYDKKISHRALSFMNFLDQKNMANIKDVFTRVNLDKFRWQYKDIINYVFNNSKIKEIVASIKQLREKENELKQLEKNEEKYQIQKELLFTELKKINIEVKSIREAKDAFLCFEKKHERPALKPEEKDYKFLLVASQSLAEEIKVQQCFNGQGKRIVSRQENIEKLLNCFKSILSENPCYSYYMEPINKMLYAAKEKADAFTTIDVAKTVKQLNEEKEGIDLQIEEITSKLTNLKYKDVEKSIGICGNLLTEIEKFGQIANTDSIKESIKTLKERIESLKQSFDLEGQKKISESITDDYEKLKSGCEFASEDFNKQRFGIVFAAKRVELYGEIEEDVKLKDGKTDKRIMQYIPGSMARQTTWQILCYIEILKYVLTVFKGLPLLPILVLDNISMPYDVERYKQVYNVIKEVTSRLNIQVILTSNVAASEIGETEQIDINQGLNPAYIG